MFDICSTPREAAVLIETVPFWGHGDLAAHYYGALSGGAYDRARQITEISDQQPIVGRTTAARYGLWSSRCPH